MLIAPTEPPALRSLGKTSWRPERFGADVLFPAHGRLVAIQRKEIKDLLASLNDGRLQREIAQMKSEHVGLAVLVVEGKPRWTLDGVLVGDGFGWQWNRSQHRGLMLSVQSEGVLVTTTEDLTETIEAVADVARWARKRDHTSLLRRPKPKSSWGKAGTVEFERHLLQSFDGIGPKQADRIIERFGGVPMAWTVGVEELRAVPGIGPVRARRMVQALGEREREMAS